jgi:hypothetical protein
VVDTSTISSKSLSQPDRIARMRNAIPMDSAEKYFLISLI